MKVTWVILNETKDAVVEVFETDDPNSQPHWELFFKHLPGCVFCGRESTNPFNKQIDPKPDWYYDYFFWKDMSKWGKGPPDGIAWSAAMTLPEPIKMLEFLKGV